MLESKKMLAEVEIMSGRREGPEGCWREGLCFTVCSLNILVIRSHFAIRPHLSTLEFGIKVFLLNVTICSCLPQPHYFQEAVFQVIHSYPLQAAEYCPVYGLPQETLVKGILHYSPVIHPEPRKREKQQWHLSTLGSSHQPPLNCCLVAKLCPTLLLPHEPQPTSLLCPWNFPARILDWLAISFSREFS